MVRKIALNDRAFEGLIQKVVEPYPLLEMNVKLSPKTVRTSS